MRLRSSAWFSCRAFVVAVLLAETACFGPVRYVERPVLVGDAGDWSLEVACLYEWCSPEGWRVKGTDVSIDMLPTRGTRKDRFFSIQTTILSRNDKYSFQYDEALVRLEQGGWMVAKVVDTSTAGLSYRESMRDFFRQVPAYMGTGRLSKQPGGSTVMALPMTLFVDIEPPPPGARFVIRFAGLRRDGEAVHVPDVEFRFR